MRCELCINLYQSMQNCNMICIIFCFFFHTQFIEIKSYLQYQRNIFSNVHEYWVYSNSCRCRLKAYRLQFSEEKTERWLTVFQCLSRVKCLKLFSIGKSNLAHSYTLPVVHIYPKLCVQNYPIFFYLFFMLLSVFFFFCWIYEYVHTEICVCVYWAMTPISKSVWR